MKFLKKAAKALGTFGGKKVAEKSQENPFNEEEFATLHGGKIAASNEGIIYAGIDELNGYLFLETIILSRLNIKTFNGATLKFSGESDFSLSSDTQEIESDPSKGKNQYTTQVSFDITKEEIELIKEKKYNTVVFTFKKKSLTFHRIE